MIFDFYDKCREFLEDLIQQDPNNKELILTYKTLIEKCTEMDIKFHEANRAYDKNYDNNTIELDKKELEMRSQRKI